MRFHITRNSLLFGFCFAFAADCRALTWPIGVSTSVPSIVAAFGQYRNSIITECPGGIACSYFQRGLSLDPVPTSAGTTVRAIVAGQVVAKSISEPSLTIAGNDRKEILYRYLTSTQVVNDIVSVCSRVVPCRVKFGT